MAILVALFVATCFLAYSNGANDNFKGVASLYGCRAANYRTAISWATITTFAGSIASIFLAQALLKRFSGKGLVPDSFVGTETFLLSVAMGAAIIVILATWLGFPISTTHALTGAIVGCGLVSVGTGVNFGALGKGFVLPLLLSPLVAILLGALIYFILRGFRLICGVKKELCICLGAEERVVALPQPHSILAFQTSRAITLTVDQEESCQERYAGSMLGLTAQQIMDGAHFLSAGVVSFARGLNDTPKIVAMLLLLKAMDIRWGFFAVAVTMAVGGLLNARRVAETMSHKITAINHGQGLSANLTTGLLVIMASVFGLPVSTTQVSVGALFGMGVITGQANLRVMANIVLSWLITLPCAAIISGAAYALLKNL
ncbi:MAG TPA: inorganic phosphate transporter [Chthoniobacterales bacterium]|jgi:PiT family inorganic phosphate transporter|nr:inorganic phosphate transporter [Chthoniobacterales bacterium]